MKKRIISLILVVLLLALCLPTTALAASSLSNFVKVNTYKAGQFTDVQNQWFAPYVQAAYEYGLINGSSKTTFSPGNNLTIAEAIKLAACIHSIYNTGKANFTPGTPWYQPYVDYAIQNNIISEPFSDYTIPATRSDFALIFSKALPDEALSVINKIDSNAIPDVMTSYSYAPAVYKLYRAGILTGSDSAGTFYPNSNITRDAVAAIATRMANSTYRQAMTLKQKELTATEISTLCSPAVFYVELLSKTGTTVGSGSGFFISSDGLAVTNYHVIDKATNAKITTKEGKKYDITGIVDFNKETDLAIIKVAGSGFPTLTLGDSDSVVTGASIYSVGYPLGVDQAMAPGAITNASHEVDGHKFIMISAPISPGNSGGALVDSRGTVIGVTSASYTEGQNLNLAVPINLLNSLDNSKNPVPLSELFAKEDSPHSNAISASPSNITIAKGSLATVTITDPSGNPDDTATFLISDESIVSCTWDVWTNNYSCPLYIEGLNVGTTTVTVSLLDVNDKTLATTTIKITVSAADPSQPTYNITANPSYVSIATGSQATVTLTDPSGNPDLNFTYLISDESKISCTWGEWVDDYSCPISIKGLSAGKAMVIIMLKDNNNNVLAIKRINVTVS